MRSRVRRYNKLRLLLGWLYVVGFCIAIGATRPLVYAWQYWQGWRLRTLADEATVLSLARTYNRQLYPTIQGFVSSFFLGGAHFTYMRLPCWQPGLNKTVISSGSFKLVIISHL
jgi:hypothetical protein